jgi:hypothetical protein
MTTANPNAPTTNCIVFPSRSSSIVFVHVGCVFRRDGGPFAFRSSGLGIEDAEATDDSPRASSECEGYRIMRCALLLHFEQSPVILGCPRLVAVLWHGEQSTTRRGIGSCTGSRMGISKMRGQAGTSGFGSNTRF